MGLSTNDKCDYILQNLGVFRYIIRVESLDFARGIYQHAIVVVEVQCCLA